MMNADAVYACPACRGTGFETAAGAMICTGCGARYDLVFGNVPDFAPAPGRRDSAAHSYTYSYSSRFYEWGRTSVMMQYTTGLSWKEELKLLLQALNLCDGARVLDVGCGTGIVARQIAACRVPAKVWGLDYSYSQLRQAEALRKKYGLHNMSLAHGTAAMLPFGDCVFHRALTVGSMQFYGDIAAFFREAARVLQPGGRLVALNYLSPACKKGGSALIRRVQATAVRHGDHLFDKQELYALAAGAGLQVTDFVEKGIVFIMTAARAEES